MTWFYYALLAAVIFTIYSLLIRIYLQDHGDALIFALLSNVVLGCTLLAFAMLGGWYLRLSESRVLLILLASVLFACASALITWGRQLEEVSRVSVARQSAVIWIFVGGIMLLGEPFSVMKVAGVLLILAGTLIAFWERGHFSASKGVVLVLGGSALAGAAGLIAKSMVESTVSPALYAAITSLLAALWLIAVLPRRIERLRAEIRLQHWRIAVAGGCLALTNFFLYRGYQVGEASRVAPIYSTSLIFTVLLGVMLLGERDNLRQKIAGAAIALTGVVILRLV